jgi:prolyl oligopeptidase
MRTLCWLAATVFSFGAALAQKLPDFPPAKVQDSFFGTIVDDPYRAMENDKDPAVAAWMKAHSDHAHAALEELPGYARLKARIAELDNATASRIGDLERCANGTLFYLRRGATENTYKLYLRRADGHESLLVDPDDWQKETGRPHAINYFQASPDGHIVAVGVSPGGNEMASLYLIETESRRRLGAPIDRARYSAVSWLPDGRAFFYTRGPMVAEGAPVSENFKNRRAYLHVVGTDPKADVLIAGVDGNPRVPLLPTQSPSVVVTPGSAHAVLRVYDGVQKEIRLYAAPLAAAGKADAPWVRISDVADKVTEFAVRGDQIYLRTHRDSARSSIVKTGLADPDLRQAEVVVPPGDGVVSAIGAARDALYFETRESAIKRLYRLPWSAKVPAEVRFPVEGALSMIAVAPDIDGLIVEATAWTRAREIYEVARDGTVRNTGLQPLGPFDAPTDLVHLEVKARSHDGTLVPMSIIHRKGVVLDGRNPTMLIGYGSYGISFDAYFDPVRLAWLEQGGVYAFANVRGSGAYGEDWHKAAFKTTKSNTWKDFIACAEYLIAQKYTSPGQLGIVGGSAGGITAGRALTERPDLFATAVLQVGMLDFVRLHVMPIGPVNVVEFGDIQKEDEFRGLLAMSSYHHVKAGTKYPAVLLQHGVNDGRVNVGQSNKMAARLMAASTSCKPILLDLEYDGGHGQGGTKLQRQRQLANSFAFQLQQAGRAPFQPIVPGSC